MKIEDFFDLLKSFDKLWFDFEDEPYSSGELPLFEKTGIYSKFSKIDYSNDSVDVYVGYMDMGVVHMDVDNNEKKILGFDKYECTQFMNKKIFIEGKPIKEHMAIACHMDELHKIKNADIYISSKLIGETFPDIYRVVIDMEKVSFNHFDTGEPDYEEAARLVLEIGKMKANRKVMNWFIELHYLAADEEDKYKRLSNKYPPEAVEILKKNRINDYGFSPIPYYSKKKAPLSTKISGLSNLPKVDEVIKRIDENKQQTTAGSLMKPMVENFMKLDDNKKADILLMAAELENKINDTQEKLRKYVYNIILHNNLKSFGDDKITENVVIDDFEVKFEMKK